MNWQSFDDFDEAQYVPGMCVCDLEEKKKKTQNVPLVIIIAAARPGLFLSNKNKNGPICSSRHVSLYFEESP